MYCLSFLRCLHPYIHKISDDNLTRQFLCKQLWPVVTKTKKVTSVKVAFGILIGMVDPRTAGFLSKVPCNRSNIWGNSVIPGTLIVAINSTILATFWSRVDLRQALTKICTSMWIKHKPSYLFFWDCWPNLFCSVYSEAETECHGQPKIWLHRNSSKQPIRRENCKVNTRGLLRSIHINMWVL